MLFVLLSGRGKHWFILVLFGGMGKVDQIYFAALREGARLPQKRREDGWYDLYLCFAEESVEIAPHSVALLPTGIASAFSPRYRIAFGERGSNTKSNLKVSAGKIDSGYRGEYFVALHNDNAVPVRITKMVQTVTREDGLILVPYASAVCQFAVELVPEVEIVEISYEALLQIPSERGFGALGSTEA